MFLWFPYGFPMVFLWINGTCLDICLPNVQSKSITLWRILGHHHGRRQVRADHFGGRDTDREGVRVSIGVPQMSWDFMVLLNSIRRIGFFNDSPILPGRFFGSSMTFRWISSFKRVFELKPSRGLDPMKSTISHHWVKNTLPKFPYIYHTWLVVTGTWIFFSHFFLNFIIPIDEL